MQQIANRKPNWYRVIIDHGPGHQSRTVRYVYSTTREIRTMIEEGNYDCPIATVRKINKVPIEIKKQFIAAEISKIKRSKEMLKVLRATAVTK